MHADIQQAITEALSSLGVTDVTFVVEHPTDLSHGDYATNVALVTAKELGEAPRQCAERIVAALQGKLAPVESVDIAGPGFINFHLKREWFVAQTKRIIEAGDAWGTNDDWKDKVVLVEYTDPNPFKEFHIGHLFTNAVGESIARLCLANGATTKRLNYQGDVGLHVAHAIYGMQQLGITSESSCSAKDLGKAYALGATAYKTGETTVVEIIRDINKKVYSRDDEVINALYDLGRSVSLAYFEEIYAVVGTVFDEYFFESEAGPKGVELINNHPDVFTDSDGAKVFVGEEYGLHTRVFLNSEGLPTYEAKELALAKMKEDRLGQYDLSIISTSNEITEYFKVLKKAMSFVYPDLATKTEHIGHGTVRLSSGKMSSRTGDVIAAVDFIAEVAEAAIEKMRQNGGEADIVTAQKVAVSAIKYATLKGNILQDSVFDKEQALSFEGSSGPYLQYTGARINSVVEKAASVDVAASVESYPGASYVIERLVYRYPEVVKEAFADRAPHKIATYLTALAGEYNSFYAEEKIADPTDEYAPYKVALSQAVAQTLKNGLWVLGIEAVEKM